MNNKVVMGIAVVVLVAGGIYISTSYNKTDTVVPETKSDPYEGWETYTNEEFGFSFKYPEEFILEKPFERESLDDRPDRVTLLGDTQLERVYVRDKRPYGIWITIVLSDNPNGLSIEQWMDEKVLLVKPIEGLTINSVTIAGVPALWSEVGPGEYHGFSIYTVFSKDDGIFDMGISTNPRQLDIPLEEARKISQKLIDSFEFTN